MATKGASFRYGNTNGSRTEHIRFAWAKGFNRGGLERHFHDHGKEFGATTAEEYVSKAVHFANTVDRKPILRALSTAMGRPINMI